MSARQEKRDAAYLERLKSLAGETDGPQQSLDEISRWEGLAAAVSASIRRPARSYTPLRSNYSRQTDPLAILALVFGILGGVLGVIFGHLAIYRIGKTDDNGFGLAVAGLVLGYISIVFWVIWILAAVAMAANTSSIYG